MMKIDELKWSDAIISIRKIVIIESRIGELKILYDERLNKQENKKDKMKKIKEKSQREFIFINDKDMRNFIFLLRGNFLSLTNKHLEFEVGKN